MRALYTRICVCSAVLGREMQTGLNRGSESRYIAAEKLSSEMIFAKCHTRKSERVRDIYILVAVQVWIQRGFKWHVRRGTTYYTLAYRRE